MAWYDGPADEVLEAEAEAWFRERPARWPGPATNELTARRRAEEEDLYDDPIPCVGGDRRPAPASPGRRLRR